RYFVDMTSMKEHFRSKVHKKSSYIPPKKVEVQTQPLEEVIEMEASS
ncbi:zinc finger protein 593, partial [Antrostomus carolinensis]